MASNFDTAVAIVCDELALSQLTYDPKAHGTLSDWLELVRRLGDEANEYLHGMWGPLGAAILDAEVVGRDPSWAQDFTLEVRSIALEVDRRKVERDPAAALMDGLEYGETDLVWMAAVAVLGVLVEREWNELPRGAAPEPRGEAPSETRQSVAVGPEDAGGGSALRTLRPPRQR